LPRSRPADGNHRIEELADEQTDGELHLDEGVAAWRRPLS
jgi:hypothetical protein